MSDNINDNIKAEKESVLIFVSLAEEFYKNNAFDEAVSYCKMALHQIPDMQEAKELLLKIYEKTGNAEEIKKLKGQAAVAVDAAETATQTLDNVEQNQSDKETDNTEQADEETVKQAVETEEPAGEKEFYSADETENLLDNALADINNIKGVLGSIIIEESGIIIKEKTVQGLDAEVASALFSTIFYVSEEAISKISLGAIDRIFMEIGKVRIYLFKGNGYIIGIFTEEIVKIGLIHVSAKRLLKNIKEVLGV